MFMLQYGPPLEALTLKSMRSTPVLHVAIWEFSTLLSLHGQIFAPSQFVPNNS